MPGREDGSGRGECPRECYQVQEKYGKQCNPSRHVEVVDYGAQVDPSTVIQVSLDKAT